jgi:hypothetical protein
MVAHYHLTPLPAGCEKHASNETGSYSLSISGDLPPGIQFRPGQGSQNGGAPFAGTPRQPGNWSVMLDAAFGCLIGPDRSAYHYKIPVTFNVQP